jgi:5-bromo-4-chloroindolyl phosphate hydrolysis protein
MFAIFVFLLPVFYIYAKAIDESCMVKKIRVNKLTEGDWLYQDKKIGKKIIKANWDGLTKKDIKLLKKNFKEIKIKQGIPFTPVFLISFLILVLFYFLKLELWNSFW